MFRAITLISCVALAAVAADEFRDVKQVVREKKDPSKFDRKDGALWIDKDNGGLVFISDDKPLSIIPVSNITGMRYNAKTKTLTVQHKDARGAGAFVEYQLNSDNRETLMSTLEALTTFKVERISGK